MARGDGRSVPGGVGWQRAEGPLTPGSGPGCSSSEASSCWSPTPGCWPWGLPEAAAWLAAPGLVVGVAGLAVGLRLRSAPRWAVVAGGLGVLVLALDFFGLSGPPRFIPGTLLLAGAAVVGGSAVTTEATQPAAGRSSPLALVAVLVGAVAHAAVGLAILRRVTQLDGLSVVAVTAMALGGRPRREPGNEQPARRPAAGVGRRVRPMPTGTRGVGGPGRRRAASRTARPPDSSKPSTISHPSRAPSTAWSDLC